MNACVWKSATRTWLGPAAGLVVVIASAWLLSVYVHFKWTEPADKALIESLKEKARTDADIQKMLVPETQRQHEAAMSRRKAYDRGALALVVACSAFLVWLGWFRPSPGQGAGLPGWVLRYIEKPLLKAPALPFRPQSVLKTEKPPQVSTAIAAGAEPLLDLAPVDRILEAEGRGPEAAIPVLQAIQDHYRYLPAAALRRVCEASEITPAQVSGVGSFYGQFRHRPVGEHIIRVCEGTACHVSGSVEIETELRRCLGISGSEDTDPSRQFTLERVACLGSCSLAPVITIDDKIYGHVSALSARQVLRDFLERQDRSAGNNGGRHRLEGVAARKTAVGSGPPVEILVGMGTCGIAGGAAEVRAAIEHQVGLLGGNALVKAVGCNGLCHLEPLVEVVEDGRRASYGNVTAADARKLVREHVKPRGAFRHLREGLKDVGTRLFEDSAWNPLSRIEFDAAPYLKRQARIVLENCGAIDPLSIEEYRKREGWRALEECLTSLSPEEVIERVRCSGLRGRGGAGFSTAAKWAITRGVPGTPKYVICNADEGDPGAFMDRAVLEADPFRVMEGLAIAAYAVGAEEGFIYVRREYPLAVRHVRSALLKAEEEGLLGENILGSRFRFRVHVREGAGAFVCGEETALIQSLEGQRGMPRLRPPYPAQSGLRGKPTLINNVETLACVPWILRRGPEAFAALGTEKSRGTKVFALAGKVRRGGLIEVPMGITIREIVEEVGGGVRDGRSFKAVLIGGPSGGCIPARLAGTRVDYEELASTGSIMGSGGLVVLDDRDCVVEIARYFLRFTQDESCGKCTFCRIGTRRMLEILERICAGKGREADLRILADLGERIRKGSLCGLGQTAPNPALTTLRYFREEYEAHVRERRCPAAQCKALIHYEVLDNCTGCTLCAQACPAEAIEARPYLKHEVIDERCTRCGMCVTACPEDAIRVA